MYRFLSIQMFLRSKDNFEGVLFLAFNNEGSVSTNSAFISFRSNSEGVEKLRDDKIDLTDSVWSQRNVQRSTFCLVKRNEF